MARGAVHQARDGRWYVRYDAEPKPNGDRDQRYKGGFATEQEADAYLIACLYEVNTGRHTRPTRQTFGEYAEEWVSLVLVRDSTRESYRGAVLALSPLVGQHPLASLKAKHLQQAIRTARGTYAESTAAQIGVIARLICRAAVKEGLLAPGILDGFSARKPAPAEHRLLEPWEVAAFLARAADDPFAALWETYARTGLRRGEALGLCWPDLDLAKRRLSVRRQAVLVSGCGVKLTPPKTKRSTRTIAIDAVLAAVLSAHREQQRAAYLATGVGKPKTDLVFPRTPGVALTPTKISGRFSLLAQSAGLPGTRLHDLRHARATHMLRDGMNPRMVADYLGHDVAMLLRVYSHALPADQDRAVARMADLLSAAQALDLVENTAEKEAL